MFYTASKRIYCALVCRCCIARNRGRSTATPTGGTKTPKSPSPSAPTTQSLECSEPPLISAATQEQSRQLASTWRADGSTGRTERPPVHRSPSAVTCTASTVRCTAARPAPSGFGRTPPHLPPLHRPGLPLRLLRRPPSTARSSTTGARNRLFSERPGMSRSTMGRFILV
jgi:hypothetical protein